MTMSTREDLERGTETFNAHDIDGQASHVPSMFDRLHMLEQLGLRPAPGGAA
jgi:hypothetical protein